MGPLSAKHVSFSDIEDRTEEEEPVDVTYMRRTNGTAAAATFTTSVKPPLLPAVTPVTVLMSCDATNMTTEPIEEGRSEETEKGTFRALKKERVKAKLQTMRDAMLMQLA